MKRYCTAVLLLALSLPGTRIAEAQSESIDLYVDPIVGTWKLNFARSTINAALLPRFPVPPNQWEIYRTLEDGRFQMVSAYSDPNGLPVISAAIWPAPGGVTQGEPARSGRLLTVTTVAGPGLLYVTHLEDGRQSHFIKKMVHGDGRTMTHTVVAAISPEGRLLEHVLVWERQ